MHKLPKKNILIKDFIFPTVASRRCDSRYLEKRWWDHNDDDDEEEKIKLLNFFLFLMKFHQQLWNHQSVYEYYLQLSYLKNIYKS